MTSGWYGRELSGEAVGMEEGVNVEQGKQAWDGITVMG